MPFYYQRDACPCCRMDPRGALAAPKEMPAMPKAMPALMPMPKACLTSGPHVTRRPESLAHLHEPKRARVKEQADSTDDGAEQSIGTNDDTDKWPDGNDDHTKHEQRERPDDFDDGCDDLPDDPPIFSDWDDDWEEKDDHAYPDDFDAYPDDWQDDTDDGTDDQRKYVSPYIQAAITMHAMCMVQRLPSGRPVFYRCGQPATDSILSDESARSPVQKPATRGSSFGT